MKAVWIAAFAAIVATSSVHAAAPAADAGDAANPAYMWDLSDLYPSPEAWTAAQAKVKAQVDGLDKYKGSLAGNAKAMLTALDAISMAGKEVARLNVYASLKGDEDVRVAVNQERVQLGQALQAEFGEKTAWVAPEVLGVGAKKVHEFETQSPELAHRFDFYLDNILRGAPHTLSPEAEGVMASAQNVLHAAEQHLQPALQRRAAVPGRDAVRRHQGRAPRPGRLCEIPPGAEPRRPQAGVRHVLGHVEEIRRHVRRLAEHAGAWPRSSTPRCATIPMRSPTRSSPTTCPRRSIASSWRRPMRACRCSTAISKLRKKLLGINDDLAYYDIYPTMFKLDQPAALHRRRCRAHRLRRDRALRAGICRQAPSGVRGPLDGRAAARGQGVGRLYERLGL